MSRVAPAATVNVLAAEDIELAPICSVPCWTSTRLLLVMAMPGLMPETAVPPAERRRVPALLSVPPPELLNSEAFACRSRTPEGWLDKVVAYWAALLLKPRAPPLAPTMAPALLSVPLPYR